MTEITVSVIDEKPITVTVDETESVTITVDEEPIEVTVMVAEAVEVPVGGDWYDGDYTAVPKAEESTVLQTRGLLMRSDVTVTKIPYYQTYNVGGGDTVFIASEVVVNGD